MAIISLALRALLFLALVSPLSLCAQVTGDAPAGNPAAVLDLNTKDAMALLKAQWRYADAKIVAVQHHAPGPDLKPSGPANQTNDIEPQAGAAEFDDSKWERLDPPNLDKRRGNGRLSFNWYRTSLTIPAKVGDLDVNGAAVVFEIVVDDYAEVWVNGRLPVVLGQAGGGMVRGFNAPNRVLLTPAARVGDKFTIALFGANGPLSSPPGNFIWVRSATLDFYKPGNAGRRRSVEVSVDAKDATAMAAIVPDPLRLEKVAEGFQFTEGPVWVPANESAPGYLLFSDPNANTIYRWAQDGSVSVFRSKSGYAGMDVGEYGQPGSNGLTLDREGRLTINEHGNHRVVRIEKTGFVTLLADSFEGKRLNSPNDLVYKSDGSLYFTDPPFGLPMFFQDPRKRLPYSGVFRWRDGQLSLQAKDLSGPNGIAFSPDERFLYVGNWDVEKKVVMRYPVGADGSLEPGTVFFDMTSSPGEEALDGIKVDELGNLYVSGPGGLWVLSPDGAHLGTIHAPEHPHNLAWGDDDGHALYLAAQTGIYRLPLKVGGKQPGK